MQLKRINSAIDRVGRNDINENFDILERGYGKAAMDAQHAVETSDEAKQKAESVQEQFNQVVIEGDSSIEAAQARVSVNDTVYTTLKERLDVENAQITQQLEHITLTLQSLGAKDNDKTFDNKNIIQNAIDYVHSKGGGTVLVDNLYYSSAPIYLKSNVELKATGGTLKMLENAPDFWTFLYVGGANNVSINGLKIDTNSEKQVTDITYTNARMAIYVLDSQNININNNNILSSGVWAIMGGANATQNGNKNINITNNKIEWVQIPRSEPLPGLPEGVMYDNTQIFMYADGFIIKGNEITSNDYGALTAIELHKWNGTAENNIVRGFRTGTIVASEQEFDTTKPSGNNHIVCNNRYFDVRTGIVLHPFEFSDLTGVEVRDNAIHLDPDRYPEYEFPTLANGISIAQIASETNLFELSDVSIINNKIYFKPLTHTYTNSDFTLQFAGISLFCWFDLNNVIVKDNIIIDAPGVGVGVGGNTQGNKIYTAKNIEVSGNIIKDAGIASGLVRSNKCAIALIGGFDGVNVQRNTINDTSTGTRYSLRDVIILDRLGKSSFFVGNQTSMIGGIGNFNNVDSTSSDIAYFVNPFGGDNSGHGNSWQSPFKTISYAITRIPKVVNHNVTIAFTDGTFDEDVVLSGFTGKGSLTITGDTSLLTSCKSLTVNNCSIPIVLKFLKLTDTTKPACFISNCSMVTVTDSVVETVAAQPGISVRSSRAHISNCNISNRSVALRADESSSIISNGWKSTSNNQIGLVSTVGSTVVKMGTQPYGVTMETVSNGGVIR